jgi:hypothetical protein
MLDSGVLLFPDTGDHFLESLRFCALYSDHTYILTIPAFASFPPALESALRAFLATNSVDTLRPIERFFEYCHLVRQLEGDFELLRNAKLLTSLPQPEGKPFQLDQLTRPMFESLSQELKSLGNMRDALRHFAEEHLGKLPPSLADFFYTLFYASSGSYS